jgi:hypothetical protein
MKFSENSANGSPVVSYRWADMVKLKVTFHNFANRSNDSCFISNQGVSSVFPTHHAHSVCCVDLLSAQK